MRFIVLSLCVLLLCQCAAKHQPQRFAPYFATGPEDPFSARSKAERQALENKAELSLYEKRRLCEIYELESRFLKPGQARYEWLTQTISRLKEDTKGLEEEVTQVQEEARNEKESTAPGAGIPPILTSSIRQLHRKVYNLWNEDKNEQARALLLAFLNDPQAQERTPQAEWFRLLLLDFRIALDLGNLAAAEGRYQQIQALYGCAQETADAAFVLALHFFGKDEAPKALSLVQSQCDPDTSEVSAARKRYWVARFSGEQSLAAQSFKEEVKKIPLPSYYQMVSLARSQEGFSPPLPQDLQTPPAYFQRELKVRPKVHALWTLAETRLKHGLRKDALVFLYRASHLLKQEKREKVIFPLLYTAHLLHATGSHLEAMRIYSLVMEQAQKGGDFLAGESPDFVPEMFPRPFVEKIEWAARLWNVDPDLIYALMRQESAFNPMAVSSADARGLLQLMPFVARALASRWRYDRYYSDKHLFLAEENLKIASFHLYQLQNNAPHLVLIAASYNAGITRVQRWWKRHGHLPLDVFVELIPIAETRNYVKLVARNYLYYRALRGEGKADTAFLDTMLPPPPPAIGATPVG